MINIPMTPQPQRTLQRGLLLANQYHNTPAFPQPQRNCPNTQNLTPLRIGTRPNQGSYRDVARDLVNPLWEASALAKKKTFFY